MAKAIRIENWVYRNLLKYGNCALPNEYNSLDIENIKTVLEYETGLTIKLRKATFVDSVKMKKIEKSYLIAEVERK